MFIDCVTVFKEMKSIYNQSSHQYKFLGVKTEYILLYRTEPVFTCSENLLKVLVVFYRMQYTLHQNTIIDVYIVQ
mgnify:CR=1 FL=1